MTGIPNILETDHKPLLQVLYTKPIYKFPLMLQGFRIRLMLYDYQIHYVPGKDMAVADALSRYFPKNFGKPEVEELVFFMKQKFMLILLFEVYKSNNHS